MSDPSVLHIDTESKWGGGQKQTLYLVKELHARGVNTSIICKPHSGLFQRSLEQDVPAEQLNVRSELDILAACKIARIFRRGNFNIIHAHTGHAHAIAVIAAGFVKPSPPVIVTRRTIFKIKPGWFNKKKYVKPNIKYIAISTAVKDVLVKAGVADTNVQIIPIGIDLKSIKRYDYGPIGAIRRELNISSDNFVIGSIGGLVKLKGHRYLLESVAKLKEEIPEIKCIIVGAGRLRDPLEKLAERLEISDRVIFTGFRENALDIMRTFNVMVVPSLSEGFSNVALEAMALGKPVIASDIGGLKDLVRDRENGILVPIKNEEEIALAVRKYHQSPDYAHQLGQQARLDVQNKFTLERMINSTNEYYEKILGQTE
jgi:glycosyltransferase involved in cell wall biosynthesis